MFFMSVLPDVKPPFRSPAANNISQVQTTATPSFMSPKKRRRRNPLSQRAKILLFILAVALFIPTLTVIVTGIDALLIYNQARSGLTHIQIAQNIFSGGKHGDTTKYFNINNLQQAQQQIDAAHSDFLAVSNSLDQDALIGMSSSMLPQQITTARSLSHIGVDATEIAQQLVKSATKLSPTIEPVLASLPAQNTTTNTADATDNPGPLKPFITSDGLTEIKADLDFALPRLQDMNKYVAGVSLNSLPISASQKQLLGGILPLLPGVETGISQARGMINDIGWLLGVGQQRNFLVQPMDAGELRATGGFTGQFGELMINGAHVLPPKLKNIGQFEEDHTDQGSPLSPVFAKVAYQTPPAPYDAWWPIANYGLRDSNISADFPTSAQMAMKTYTYEFGDQLDGVITFTPTLIQNVLTVTGPITIPLYNETITAQNLQDRLHYYQLDNTGIRKEEVLENENDPQAARKLFTGRVTSTLITAVQHLPLNKLQSLVQMAFSSMKSKDLQIYVTNPDIENLIAKYGSTAAMNRSTRNDGLYIVQDNLSSSKASMYVNTSINDTIVLDASGGAQHTMQVTLDYQQKGDVYGFDTYRDYVRVYVPTGSQFTSGYGFDQIGRPWCGSDVGYGVCASDVYGDGSMICPANTTEGYATWIIGDPYYQYLHPVDRIGAPTNFTSDETGLAMYGGWVVVPKNCTMTFKLSWYAPATSNHPYSFLIQRQASTSPSLNLTIQPAPGTCSAPLHYSGTLNGQNRLFTVQKGSGGSTCSLQAIDSAQ
jgi:Protein of unknown function (DUF4012)